MLISVLIAFIVWLFLVNEENEDIEREFTGVPVFYTGDEAQLSENGLIVTGYDTTAVTLVLRGKRNIVSHIDRSEISVTLDFTTIRASGKVPCTYTINLPEEVNFNELFITKIPEQIDVNIERIVPKVIPIRGSLEGSVGEGYLKENLKFTPASLTIRGPSSRVDEIDYAWVSIVQDNVTETIVANVEPILYDIEGNVVDTQGITMDYQSIQVELPIKMQKEVSLTVNLIAGGGADIDNATVEIKPSTIRLKGESSALSAINLLPLDKIDLGTINGKLTKTVPILIDDGMENLSGELTAEVTVTIVGLSTTARTARAFAAENAAPGYSVRFITSSMLVTIRGSADEFEFITDEDITVICDVSDIARTPGVHELDAEDISVIVAGANNVGVIKNYGRVSVEIAVEEN
jgi:hypothetical protein